MAEMEFRSCHPFSPFFPLVPPLSHTPSNSLVLGGVSKLDVGLANYPLIFLFGVLK